MTYVYVKNPNGRTYVYENTSVWDKETQSVKHMRKIIGHLDNTTGEVVPNRKKGDAARAKAKTQESKSVCIVTNSGIKKLLNKAVEDIGLAETLAKVFPDDWKRLLTCAYYLVSEGKALSHVDKWQAMYESPCQFPLASQRVSELLAKITPTMQQDFFGKWIAARAC